MRGNNIKNNKILVFLISLILITVFFSAVYSTEEVDVGESNDEYVFPTTVKDDNVDGFCLDTGLAGPRATPEKSKI
ncbi:hypothetical protein ALNOE001_01100 [Candidatus Methanobinarius endosymbioticus]|uniref:Uncharacterized protein n=1 Tax=Candidatus Methanobinarius endosymbioticus TaxID=2006182 RepID=A0A366MF72_9EURY|nr:hypothetical protein ALNOE001_01100 [Candidatus Methanobinarius endosymbioticus]